MADKTKENQGVTENNTENVSEKHKETNVSEGNKDSTFTLEQLEKIAKSREQSAVALAKQQWEAEQEAKKQQLEKAKKEQERATYLESLKTNEEAVAQLKDVMEDWESQDMNVIKAMVKALKIQQASKTNTVQPKGVTGAVGAKSVTPDEAYKIALKKFKELNGIKE